jgi:hypothetical protein
MKKLYIRIQKLFILLCLFFLSHLEFEYLFNHPYPYPKFRVPGYPNFRYPKFRIRIRIVISTIQKFRISDFEHPYSKRAQYVFIKILCLYVLSFCFCYHFHQFYSSKHMTSKIQPWWPFQTGTSRLILPDGSCVGARKKRLSTSSSNVPWLTKYGVISANGVGFLLFSLSAVETYRSFISSYMRMIPKRH